MQALAERSTRQRRVIGFGLVLLLGSGLVGSWFLFRGEVEPDDGGADRQVDYEVVEVTRQTLTVGSTLNGKIGYGSPEALPIRASGTVTWLPPSGLELARGGEMMRVDDRPVILMYGDTPAYRALYDTSADTGQSDSDDTDGSGTAGGDRDQGRQTGRQGQGEGQVRQPKQPQPPPPPPPPPLTGPDVMELEENLSALGYTGFDIDEEFTPYTAEAVTAWQRDLGVPATGRVELGDVVFLPGPIRLVTDETELGGESPSSAVQQTSTEKVVTATAPSDSLGWAEPGTKVRITLPSQQTVRATVDRVRAGTDGGDGIVRLKFANAARAPASGAVTITYIAQQKRRALNVPVTALVALAEGGYGVQLDDADGTFVPVTPGLYADGRVEVDGDLKPGIKIRVPR